MANLSSNFFVEPRFWKSTGLHQSPVYLQLCRFSTTRIFQLSYNQCAVHSLMSQLFPAWLMSSLFIINSTCLQPWSADLAYKYPSHVNLCRVWSGVRINRLYTHVHKREEMQRRWASSIPTYKHTHMPVLDSTGHPTPCWDRGLHSEPRQRRGPGQAARMPQRWEQSRSLATLLNCTQHVRERATATRHLWWWGSSIPCFSPAL